jgi:mono/diheme cytochrome c family protein
MPFYARGLSVIANRAVIYLGLLIAGSTYGVTQVSAAGPTLYTADQAKRGATVYTGKQCSLCHGADLNGIDQAPPLNGDEFLSKYQNQPLAMLFDKIHMTMPATAPGSLSLAETADVLSYILSQNKYPAGSTELPNDADALKKTTLTKP